MSQENISPLLVTRKSARARTLESLYSQLNQLNQKVALVKRKIDRITRDQEQEQTRDKSNSQDGWSSYELEDSEDDLDDGRSSFEAVEHDLVDEFSDWSSLGSASATPTIESVSALPPQTLSPFLGISPIPRSFDKSTVDPILRESLDCTTEESISETPLISQLHITPPVLQLPPQRSVLNQIIKECAEEPLSCSSGELSSATPVTVLQSVSFIPTSDHSDSEQSSESIAEEFSGGEVSPSSLEERRRYFEQSSEEYSRCRSALSSPPPPPEESYTPTSEYQYSEHSSEDLTEETSSDQGYSRYQPISSSPPRKWDVSWRQRCQEEFRSSVGDSSTAEESTYYHPASRSLSLVECPFRAPQPGEDCSSDNGPPEYGNEYPVYENEPPECENEPSDYENEPSDYENYDVEHSDYGGDEYTNYSDEYFSHTTSVQTSSSDSRPPFVRSEMEQEQCSIPFKLRIPLELWTKVCEYLYPSQLARLALVNKSAYGMVAGLDVWEKWYKKSHRSLPLALIPGMPASQSYMLYIHSISFAICEECMKLCDGTYHRERLAVMPLPVVLERCCKYTTRKELYVEDWTVRFCLPCRVAYFRKNQEIPQDLFIDTSVPGSSYLSKRELKEKYHLGDASIASITNRTGGGRSSGKPVRYSERDAAAIAKVRYGGDVGLRALGKSLSKPMKYMEHRLYIYLKRQQILKDGGLWWPYDQYLIIKTLFPDKVLRDRILRDPCYKDYILHILLR
ncbi:hypothetical protein BGZ49_000542 [Haplosporangium sp. Z 27]|nr:hypothetical protein BGZ49_000542 [Haplosporangium sp. Z 27]